MKMFMDAYLEKGKMYYLAGPYTPTENCSLMVNIGRLYTYNYLLQTKAQVLCLPLLSCGMCTTTSHKHLLYTDWMERCLRLLEAADELLIVPYLEISRGTQAEMAAARKFDKSIRCLPRLSHELRYTLRQEFTEFNDVVPYAKAGLAYLDYLAADEL